MPRRFPKKHCHVLTWIEEHDEDFAQVFRDLCLVGQLNARGSGVTFLMPSAAERKRLVDLAYGADTEKAIREVQAYILPFYFPDGNKFSGEFGSKAGVRLEADKKSASEVTLKGGAVLKRADSFKALGRRGAAGAELESKVAVWEVTKGAVPATGPEFDVLGSMRRGKSGGDEAFSADLNRAEIMRPIIAEGINEMSTRKTEITWLKHLLGLLKHLRDEYPMEYYKAACVVDRSPASSLFILVEPFKNVAAGSGFFISDAAISSWGGGTSTVTDTAGELLAVFRDMERRGSSLHNQLVGGQSQPPAIFTDAGGVYNASAQLGEMLVSDASQTTPQKVLEIYSSAVDSNSVGGVHNVWPEHVVAAFRNDRKVWQDLMRFQMHAIQHAMLYESPAQGPDLDLRNTFMSLVQTVLPGSDYTAEAAQYLGKCMSGPAPAANGDRISNTCDFLRSTAFMYVPRDTAFAAKVGGGSREEHPADRNVPVNLDSHGHRALVHYSRSARPASDRMALPLDGL